MHTIQVHLDDTLTSDQMNALKKNLMEIPHVKEISMSPYLPREFMVDFDEHYNIPVSVMHSLHEQGLHPDITSC